ncbi:MAG: membrane-associated zinc metalloprotease, partial [Chloroflexi bacterium]|nr:membrane-associated zinc metalloprotease [Chloroflexota bacterium]
MTLLVFLGMLAVLILAHELGHFVTAKLAGVTIK